MAQPESQIPQKYRSFRHIALKNWSPYHGQKKEIIEFQVGLQHEGILDSARRENRVRNRSTSVHVVNWPWFFGKVISD